MKRLICAAAVALLSGCQPPAPEIRANTEMVTAYWAPDGDTIHADLHDGDRPSNRAASCRSICRVGRTCTTPSTTSVTACGSAAATPAPTSRPATRVCIAAQRPSRVVRNVKDCCALGVSASRGRINIRHWNVRKNLGGPVSRRPSWWYTMQEARRQACVAVEFYNRAGERTSFYDFVIHMHLAWQNLLHADLERRGTRIYYKLPNGRYDRTPSGDKRSWDLAYCLKREFKDNDPIRANVEFFIGLRHKIEHRFQEAFIMETSAYAHALVINFETELVRRFGAEASLGDKLRFPIFIQSLTPDGLKKQRALRRALPLSARNYITQFEAQLDPAVAEDERFVYRVMMTPIKGPKTDADTAFTFVRMDDLTAEEQRAMIDSAGRAVVIEKMRDVALKDEMLPKAAAAAVRSLIPFEFTISDFTKVRQARQVGPGPRGVGRLANCRSDLCVLIKANRQWVYSEKFVKEIADLLQTEDGYRLALGKTPTRKSGAKTEVA